MCKKPSSQKAPTEATPITERGAIIVLGAIGMCSFLMMVALAMDMYFLGTAKLQQRNTAEYMALGMLRSLKDPPPGYYCSVCSELQIYNDAIAAGETLGTVPILGNTTLPQVSAGELQVSYAYGQYDEDCECEHDEGCHGEPIEPNGSGGYSMGGGSGVGDVPSSGGWCGFKSNGDIGGVAFGTYVAPTGSSEWSFTPAPPGTSMNSINAAMVTVKLRDPSISPMILPLGAMIGGKEAIMFHSTAIVYRDPSTHKYSVVQ